MPPGVPRLSLHHARPGPSHLRPTGEEALLIRLVDELHDQADISDELWTAVAGAFTVEQIFELIALVGFYHTVSFFAKGLRLAAEPNAALSPE
jgi:4-carboxymuconolactone decarboxylase